jgi:sodium/bile acid cotransporter 7
VDVRSEAERAVSIIPGSISLEVYRESIDEFRVDPVMVYCTVGCRSAGYAQSFQEQGINAYNLRGGVIDWAHYGGKFATLDGTPTRKVHTHGRRWNLLPATYVAVW